MFRKSVITCLLAAFLLFPMAGTSSAAALSKDPIVKNNGAKMTYIAFTDCYLGITSIGLAQAEASMNTYMGVDSVRISMYLQRYNSGWSTVKHWAKDFTGRYGSLSGIWFVASGYEYRLLVYYYAYDGDNVESFYDIYDGVWY